MQTSNHWNTAFAFLACALALTVPEMAAAGGFGGTDDGGPIGDVLCQVVQWFNGPVGAGIATLAVIIIGVGALLGKVSWGMAIIVGLGVAIVFGAGSVIESLTGATASC
ncbi:MAG: TrbC/VirB2 family protein [Rickettsiales bacterium]|nr:TrbC/VirB2 family protein [Rickettsiales bacterium]